jgi:uncharacterized protein YprB with RNaseH-like and TPR domain
VLSSTFLHVPGVGAITEQRIWQRGVHTWGDFLRNPGAAQLSARMTERVAAAAELSLDRLQCEDHRFFASAVPQREHWRAYPDFSHRVAYLDIETTGMGGHDVVTIIGLYDGETVRTYTRGEDLERFQEDIGQYRLLVTFFGSGFDLPFLRRRSPGLEFHQLHLDLCFALRRLGLSGGLKNIERQLAIPRSPETAGLDGWDAVRLWREWERGSRDALELLKAYNREDIVNLERLARYAYEHLRAKSGAPGAARGEPC